MIKKSIFGKDIYEYTGIIHIHTEHSFDGHGSLKEIIATATQQDIDFLLITDHRNIDVKEELLSIANNDVITIIGYEMNDSLKNNHYLIFNVDKVFPISMKVDEYVRRVKENGGTGFIAHPFEKRRSRRTLRTYAWTEWSVTDIDGIEIWNYISEWTDKLSIPWNVIPKVLFPNSSISRPNKYAVNKWDELNRLDKRLPAIGSVDSHQNKYSLGPFSVTFLPHKKLFKTIRTNIQTRKPLPDYNPDQCILDKLRSGNSYIVNYTHADPEMFYCGIDSGKSGVSVLPGEEISLSEGNLNLFVYVPQDCHIKIIKNGSIIHTEYRNKVSCRIDEIGFYRVEIYLGHKAWIFTNPIYVV